MARRWGGQTVHSPEREFTNGGHSDRSAVAETPGDSATVLPGRPSKAWDARRRTLDEAEMPGRFGPTAGEGRKGSGKLACWTDCRTESPRRTTCLAEKPRGVCVPQAGLVAGDAVTELCPSQQGGGQHSEGRAGAWRCLILKKQSE